MCGLKQQAFVLLSDLQLGRDEQGQFLLASLDTTGISPTRSSSGPYPGTDVSWAHSQGCGLQELFPFHACFLQAAWAPCHVGMHPKVAVHSDSTSLEQFLWLYWLRQNQPLEGVQEDSRQEDDSAIHFWEVQPALDVHRALATRRNEGSIM